MIATIPVTAKDAVRIEQECHRQLRSRFASRGEWYNRASEDVVAIVRAVCSSSAVTSQIADPLRAKLDSLQQEAELLQYEMLRFDRVRVIFSSISQQLGRTLDERRRTAEKLDKVVPEQNRSDDSSASSDEVTERGTLESLQGKAEEFARLGRLYEPLRPAFRRLSPENETMQLEYLGLQPAIGEEAHVLRLHSRTSLIDHGLGCIVRLRGRYHYWPADCARSLPSAIPDEAQDAPSLLEAFIGLDSKFMRTL